jgi:glycosyltransferase involved in cell wall biosynthesis
LDCAIAFIFSGAARSLTRSSFLRKNRAMKISGFTFVRNGVELGYPFQASIRSLLPLCDEVIVNVPESTDDTLEQVRSINDPKIRIIQSEWDRNLRTAGHALSHHTNIALRECAGDWCVYIQADEVLHEDSIPGIRATMERELNNRAVQGLLVNYTHFYGSYSTYVYSFGWYYQEVRIIRRDPNIRSLGDAQGFRTVDRQKLFVKNSGGKYFHYGHALDPERGKRKLRNLSSLYHDDAGVAEEVDRRSAGFYDDDQKVKQFTGTHPSVMREIVAAANWTYTSRNPLIRFRRDYFWEDIALIVKRCTGLTIGVHRNYRILKK